MFWSKNKKNRYTPAYPSLTIYKWGIRGYLFHGHVFLMVRHLSEKAGQITVRTIRSHRQEYRLRVVRLQDGNLFNLFQCFVANK